MTKSTWFWVAALVVSAPPSMFAVNFDGSRAYFGGGYAVAKGDFNGDGAPDIAVATLSTVAILLNNGDGSFGPVVDYNAGSVPHGIAVGDFNGDGKLDLVAANSESSTVSILLGKGDGTFQPPVNYTANSYPSSVTIGDYNGDGNPDVAVLDVFANIVSILLGTLQPAVNYAVGQSPYSAVVGDFNGDGKLDLAISEHSSVSILLGNGDGTFQSTTRFPTGEARDRLRWVISMVTENWIWPLPAISPATSPYCWATEMARLHALSATTREVIPVR